MIGKNSIFLIALALTVLQAGCASSQSSPAASDKTAKIETPQVAEAPVPDDFNGDGMTLKIDGSSIESFDASMATIKRYTDEKTYASLNSAIGYLMVYDLQVRSNKEKLIAKLDGKTGYEVKTMVDMKRLAPEKGTGGKIPAVPGTIDT